LDFETGRVNSVVLLLLVLFTVASIWLTIYLGNRFPGKRWLGILLSIIFAPWGQIYLEGATRYIVALVLITMFSKVALDSYLLTLICSPVMMWVRFNKQYKTKVPDQKKEEAIIPFDKQETPP